MSVAAAPYSTRRAAQSAISPEQHTDEPMFPSAQTRAQVRFNCDYCAAIVPGPRFDSSCSTFSGTTTTWVYVPDILKI